MALSPSLLMEANSNCENPIYPSFTKKVQLFPLEKPAYG